MTVLIIHYHVTCSDSHCLATSSKSGFITKMFKGLEVYPLNTLNLLINLKFKPIILLKKKYLKIKFLDCPLMDFDLLSSSELAEVKNARDK